ncbi:MAG: hypothetical protein J07HX5_00450 [halophilic archaeon J07HX5]|nr:MAG: hypothetical protein J07HX5_00450 [halophilic archaeon J07HX5]
MVDCWRCQTAVTPILNRVRRPCVGFATGTPAGVSRVGGLSCSLSAVGTGTRFSHVCSPTALSDTASLRGWTGHLRRTVRNPLRSDRFLSYDRSAYQLNVTTGNSRQACEQWTVSTTDGAYPRPEGRGIAPVRRITRPWGLCAARRCRPAKLPPAGGQRQ